ncbi:MAG: phosphate/phosphite/phosphonate ABC transporter substrate-binding protein [Alphaproteobacteria bacterium]|nr:phosphate/phosphite/phosphonate ABC transporter substrate-binding protein [Alphaproteobacteria bacterium]
MRIRTLLMAAAFLAATAVGSHHALAAEKKAELTFAVIQTEDMSVLASRWEPMLKYLNEKAGVKISFYATTSYSAVIEAMLSGFVQIAQLGPKAYLIANDKSKGRIQPLVAAARIPTAFDPTPCACYYGTLITKKGSGLDSIAKLEKKVLALVDPGSTSGNAMPRGLFTVEKLDGNPLENHFGRIFYSGHHVASVMAVKKGKADAAFVSESMIARAMDRGKAKKEDFNYLWRSPKIAIDSVSIDTSKISPALAKKIRNVYLGMDKDPVGKKILAAAKYSKFVFSEDATYNAVRKILAAKKKLKAKKKK